MTVSTREYHFKGGNQYQLIEGSGSGTNTSADKVKLIYQTTRGTYAVQNWEVSLQQEASSAYFMAVPNGRLLVLVNQQGSARIFSKIN